jgi:hypothetical protein
MVNSHYGKRLNLFQCYLIIISAIFIEYHECRRDYKNCCEVLKIISSSFLEKFHPEHLGSYKLMKNSKYVYKSLTEPNSYIYLLKLGKGNSEILNFDIAILNFEKAHAHFHITTFYFCFFFVFTSFQIGILCILWNHIFFIQIFHLHSAQCFDKSFFADTRWVIGKDYKKREFVASWPKRDNKILKKSEKANFFSIFLPARFQQQPTKVKRKIHKESFCPLEEGIHIKRFEVWDGYQFIKDNSMSVECTIEKVDTIIEGCCETIRVASSYSNSISMQSQRHKMG